jgi:FKBP-type peptidyl-prolyl cis-trans isomerase FklB
MKKILIIISFVIVTAANAQTKKSTSVAKSQTKIATLNKTTIGTKGTPVSKSSIDSFSYALGLNIAANLNTQGIENLNYTSLQKAMEDVFNKRTPLLNENQARMSIQNKLMTYMANKSAAAKAEGKKFLDENKKKPGVIELPSGLQYQVIKQGTGAIPKSTDTVKAHYAGTLINGEEFDNSYKRGEPLQIGVSSVIAGWTQALQLMPVGSKWKLFIPSSLGYGDRAAGAIPPGSVLIFDIELIDIVHK